MVSTRASRAKSAFRASVEAGCGNLFTDLELPEDADRLTDAELERVIRSVVGNKSWTQRYPAEILGIAPRIGWT